MDRCLSENRSLLLVVKWWSIFLIFFTPEWILEVSSVGITCGVREETLSVTVLSKRHVILLFDVLFYFIITWKGRRSTNCSYTLIACIQSPWRLLQSGGGCRDQKRVLMCISMWSCNGGICLLVVCDLFRVCRPLKNWTVRCSTSWRSIWYTSQSWTVGNMVQGKRSV